MVAKGVSDGRGAFFIIHFTHLVEAHSPGLQGAGIRRVHVANIEMEARGHCLPLARRPAGLDDATLNAKGCVHGLSVVGRPPLLSQFLGSEGCLGERDELVWVLHGDERGHRREPWRYVCG